MEWTARHLKEIVILSLCPKWIVDSPFFCSLSTIVVPFLFYCYAEHDKCDRFTKISLKRNLKRINSKAKNNGFCFCKSWSGENTNIIIIISYGVFIWKKALQISCKILIIKIMLAGVKIMLFLWKHKDTSCQSVGLSHALLYQIIFFSGNLTL